LRFISLSLRRTVSKLRTTEFARLDLGLFSKPSKRMTFYESIISSRILDHLDIRRTAYSHLRQLHQQVNETVNLTILRNGQVTFIDKIQKVGGLSLDTYIGFSTAPHAAASGKVLLSELGRSEIEAIYRTKSLKAYGKNTITSKARLPDSQSHICAQLCDRSRCHHLGRD